MIQKSTDSNDAEAPSSNQSGTQMVCARQNLLAIARTRRPSTSGSDKEALASRGFSLSRLWKAFSREFQDDRATKDVQWRKEEHPLLIPSFMHCPNPYLTK